MVEGLDISVEDRYGILRDESFLRDYGPAGRVVERLESNLKNGNRERTKRSLAELGIKVDSLDDKAIISAYLEGLNQERLTRMRVGSENVNPKTEKFRTHYGTMALMCRVL